MAKGRAMINTEKEKAKELTTKIALVRACLNQGFYSRREICAASGMKPHELSALFVANRDIYAEYTVARSSLAHTAADNIADIVNDPTHPKCYEASKWVATNYKTDFDDVLTPTAGEMEIKVPQGQEGDAPVVIRFAAPTKQE